MLDRIISGPVARAFAALLVCSVVCALSYRGQQIPNAEGPYPTPTLPVPATEDDAFVTLAGATVGSSHEITGLLRTARATPWSELDVQTFTRDASRLDLAPAAAAFERARHQAAFGDPLEEGAPRLHAHVVFRAALLSVVVRALAEDPRAHADLVALLTLADVHARDARSPFTLLVAQEELELTLALLTRTSEGVPAAYAVRRSDGGRVARFELAHCHRAVVEDPDDLVFDPNPSHRSCVDDIRPWIEFFEQDGPRPPTRGPREQRTGMQGRSAFARIDESLQRIERGGAR